VNTIEGYWSRLKNSIRGTHVHVSGKHLQKYAGEFEYRYNSRKQPRKMLAELSDDFSAARRRIISSLFTISWGIALVFDDKLLKFAVKAGFLERHHASVAPLRHAALLPPPHRVGSCPTPPRRRTSRW
jgi:hypothetical protein